MFSYWAKAEHTAWLSRFLNEHVVDTVRQEPHRFIALGTVPLQSPQLAVEEIKHCKSLGMNGIMIGTHVNELNLDDKQFDPVWKTCSDFNLPIFVHPWGMKQTGRMSKYWLPYIVGMPAETSAAICSMIFSGVFEQFPKLKVCFAHGAGMLPYIFGRAEHGFHVYPNDMQKDNPYPPRKYLNQIYADSLLHTEDAIELLIKLLGEVNKMPVCGNRLTKTYFEFTVSLLSFYRNAYYLGSCDAWKRLSFPLG